jgi:cell division protein FtsW
MFIVGMLASFARAEPDAAIALHARRRAWWSKMWGIPLPPLPVAQAVPPRQRAQRPAAARRPARPAREVKQGSRQRPGAGGADRSLADHE